MLFVLIIIALIAGIALIIIGDDHYDWRGYLVVPGMLLTVIGGVALLFSLFLIPIEHLGADGYVAGKRAEYETIMYQLENDIYENDNDIGKRELMVDVQEWNKWLAKGQAMQNDFWMGIYYADIYDQFEFIELGG